MQKYQFCIFPAWYLADCCLQCFITNAARESYSRSTVSNNNESGSSIKPTQRKPEWNHHDANFVITGGTQDCRDANFVATGGTTIPVLQSYQGILSWHHDHSQLKWQHGSTKLASWQLLAFRVLPHWDHVTLSVPTCWPNGWVHQWVPYVGLTVG